MIRVSRENWEALRSRVKEAKHQVPTGIGYTYINAILNYMNRVESQPASTDEIDPDLVNEMSTYIQNLALTGNVRAREIVSKLSKPVDPDLVKAREWFASQYPGIPGLNITMKGDCDDAPLLRGYLAGLKARS